MDNIVDPAKRTRDDRDVTWVLVGEGRQRQDIERRVAGEGLSRPRLLPLQMKHDSNDLLRQMGERNRAYAETYFDERKVSTQRQFLLSRLRSRTA